MNEYLKFDTMIEATKDAQAKPVSTPLFLDDDWVIIPSVINFE